MSISFFCGVVMEEAMATVELYHSFASLKHKCGLSQIMKVTVLLVY